MPDVSLFTASEPLGQDLKVVIKYSVEVNGLPVYQESYDARKIAAELKEDRQKAIELWARRIEGVAGCLERTGFSACLTRCLVDGTCFDSGQAPREREAKRT